MKFLKDKLATDIIWTLGSFAILAVSGILINIAIIRLRDASALGVFNQTYAIYLIASQFAVAGIHYSVLRNAAHYDDDCSERNRLLTTAIVMTLSLGALGAALMYLAAPAIGKHLESEATQRGIQYASFALLLFPVNKVLISYVNGIRHMRAFSILQSLRYLIVMCWVTVISASAADFPTACWAFLIAEFVTFAGSFGYVFLCGAYTPGLFDHAWMKRHFSFGLRSFLAGMFAELNSRLDVLLVGYFLSDRAVGIYSFAAMLADGLYHIIVMLRINFNPLLVAAARDNDWRQPQALLSKTRIFLAPATTVLSSLLAGAFWLMAAYLEPSKGLLAGLPSLIILLGALAAIAAFIPFDNLMLSSGHPALQALQQAVVVMTNLAIGVILIPLIGIEGAAISTALGYFAGISTFFILAKRMLGWNLVTNRMVA